ncbi:MAG: Holliday junction resolvase RuvX [Betaproteobacteria bacterium]|nr:Holliday junction resolvase RuvX [Betaproteobacteria bacterium]
MRRPRSGTVLAFDFGAKRIGVAVGDCALGIAHPLTTVEGSDPSAGFEVIAALVTEWQPVVLVVGLPSHPDGAEHAVGRRCRRFASQLHGRFGLPAVLVDERLTSAAAAESLREAGLAGRKQKSALDQVAAQHVLQTYFDTHRHAAA